MRDAGRGALEAGALLAEPPAQRSISVPPVAVRFAITNTLCLEAILGSSAHSGVTAILVPERPEFNAVKSSNDRPRRTAAGAVTIAGP